MTTVTDLATRHESQLRILEHLEKRKEVLLDLPVDAHIGFVGDVSPFFVDRELFIELFRGCEVTEEVDGTLKHTLNGVPFMSRSAGPRSTRTITLE